MTEEYVLKCFVKGIIILLKYKKLLWKISGEASGKNLLRASFFIIISFNLT